MTIVIVFSMSLIYRTTLLLLRLGEKEGVYGVESDHTPFVSETKNNKMNFQMF